MDLIKQIDQELPPDSKIRQLPGYQELMSHRTINSFLVITSPTLQECTLWWVRFIFSHREFWTRADARNPAWGAGILHTDAVRGTVCPRLRPVPTSTPATTRTSRSRLAWLVGA